jgi:hypothetical protein
LKRNKFLYLFLVLFTASLTCQAQQVERIKFKKDRSLVYFFHKGDKSDTLHKDAENYFYLLVPDSLKKDFSLEVENGQMLATENDSLVKLNYMPGFNYESFYSITDGTKKQKRRGFEFKTAVNGTSVLEHTKISISLINKKTGGLILENTFFYQ